MIYLNSDYLEGAHPEVLKKLVDTNMVQTGGYGEDEYCAAAAAKIKTLCGREDVAVHFLVGGTQTNLTVIAASLRPYQGVISADSGHINVHETGAIEATGHKVLALPSRDGKLTADQIRMAAGAQSEAMDAEHTVQPKMVYISDSTEVGTIYSLAELEAISAACKECGLYLFMDGARLGYALTAPGNDVTLPDLARLCDVFYIGGTKVGAMFGEAVVISNDHIAEDFRYMIKQRGGMLAKGWLLGLQFDTLLKDDLYFEISKHANKLAQQLRETLMSLNIPVLVDSPSNQIFPILPDAVLQQLDKHFTYNMMERIDETHSCVRFCTSWATKQEDMDALCDALVKYSK
mgnify:CR=1 FL=1